MTEKKPSFPTVRYNRAGESTLCHTQAELDALSKDWADSPAAFDKPEPPEHPEPPKHPEHPEPPEPPKPPTPPTPPTPPPPKGPHK